MYHNFFALSKQLGALCTDQNVQIALAESCTGGLLSSVITDASGSSNWFAGSAVVYSNQAKTTLLGVEESMITRCGAVSVEVASAMAEGALHRFHTEYALAITGIAGPTGGNDQKPVGTVCFALADLKGVETEVKYFTSGRGNVRQQAVLFALEWLIMHLTLE